jgi:tetratricopeptide (TPR) repeat protein
MVPSRLRIPLALLLAASSFGCRDEADWLVEYMARGNRYLEEEQYRAAIIEYRNALEIDPNLAAAHHGLARSFLKTRETEKALWELRETVRLDPSNLGARMEFGALSRLAGDAEEAVVQAQAILVIEPDNVRAMLLQGRALDQLERRPEAGAAYRAAARADPDSSAPLLLLAKHLVEQGDRKRAEPLFRRAIEVEPDFAAFAAYASFLSRDREQDGEAEAAYRSALETADGKQRELGSRLLASFYYSRDRREDSTRVLREAVEADPGNLDLTYELARLHAAQGNREEADRIMEEATRAIPGQVKPYLLLSAYREQRGDPAGALAAVEDALELQPGDEMARLRRSELLLDAGYRNRDEAKVAEGRSLVEAVLAEDPSSPRALFVKAKMNLAERHLDEAIRELRRVIEHRGDWADAYFLLGSALYLSGDRHAARVELSRALEVDANLLEARKLLTRTLADLGEIDLAIEEGRRLLRVHPNEDDVRILVAQALARQQKLAEARQALERIPEERRGAEVLFALGRVALLEGNSEAAHELLRRAAEAQPGQPEILGTLLDLETRLGRIEESVARLEAAVAESPDVAGLVRLQGLAYLRAGRGEEAEERLRRAIELDPNDLVAYRLLGGVLSHSGRGGETIATYRQAIQARPDAAHLHYVLATLYEDRGENAEALAEYEEAVRLNPGLGLAKSNLAYLLAESGRDLDRALTLAREAKALLPEQPEVTDTLGWVLYKKGIPRAALSYLKEAEAGYPASDPGRGLVQYHLAVAYEARGEPKRAREALERALLDWESHRSGSGDPGADEPPWMPEIRSLYERLRPDQPAAEAP